ncbi:MAG: glutamine--fructose-6-phosphate transaminase (isomerizing) [Elusimicrobia bacterium CG08_land_8_20_14_0_20_44_26]|nr:MAG: glutamine--fructose-6-phosphate transaminase (isomerizing) [Elusimicrobia bacterium CG08_land_8_20_14_0_20_44_26]
MCGIVGYAGEKPAAPILIEGLRRLEYRGYDSAGIAVIEKGALRLLRCKGKVSKLAKIIATSRLIKGTTGVGHTRWATHGKPSEENAHPHTDCANRITVVHNGIIENYIELRKRLVSAGHKFKSETDTEIIAHLIEKNYNSGASLLHSVQSALRELRGSYALGVLSSTEPGVIVAARKDSPLIIGLGKNENLLASDIPAILGHTRSIIALEDGETSLITKDAVEIFSSKNKKIKKKILKITWNAAMAEKEGYRHFMLKEIFEQPRAIQDTLRGKLEISGGRVVLPDIKLSANEIKTLKKIFIIACGTAYHAGLVGKFLFENLAKIPCEVGTGSEFRYSEPLVGKGDLVLAISQSGETADTLAGLRLAKKVGAKTVAICNVVGSSLTREVNGILYTHAGPEIAVASTKAFTTQLLALALMALHFGLIRKTIKSKASFNFSNDILKIPDQMRKVLKTEKEIARIAKKFCRKRDFLFLGRNLNYPIALEGALKLKEISYIHAEGYPAGEMKHGPIALIDDDMPVVAVASKSKVYEKMLSNINEAKTRNGTIIALATKGDSAVKKIADEVIYVPDVNEYISPIINVIPLQLLAYYVALYRKCDIDQPRNLAKSVVVE